MINRRLLKAKKIKKMPETVQKRKLKSDSSKDSESSDTSKKCKKESVSLQKRNPEVNDKETTCINVKIPSQRKRQIKPLVKWSPDQLPGPSR
jgi:hypothetical protein